MVRRKRRSDDERAIAAARLVYREGLSDEAIRRTATYQDLREFQERERKRRKMLREDRKEFKEMLKQKQARPDPQERSQ